MAPDIPLDEAERILSLHSLGLLDTEPEERFDRITRLAKNYFEFPITLISLVDRQRQWFKSSVGIGLSESPRDTSFCGHAILQQDIFEVADATQDPRFKNNPFVINEPHIRAYYGIPLKAPDGHQVGTLCLIDYQPRYFSEEDRGVLRDLAAMVEDKLALNQVVQQAKASRKRELRLNAILQTETDPIISVEPDGLIIGANPATTHVFGYALDELIDHKLDKLIAKESAKNLQGILRSAAHKVERTEMKALNSKGVELILEVRASRIEVEGETQIIFIMRDISERKAYEDQLKSVLDRLRRSHKFAKIGTWEWDIKTGDLYWSESVASLFGWPSEQINMKIDAFNEAIHPDDRARVVDAVQACLQGGAGYDIEHRVIWPDGQVRWVQERGDLVYNATGEAVQMIGVVIDIHAKKLAELELMRNRKQLQQAQSRARLGNWRANLKTGELEWSPVIYEMFGLDPNITPTTNLFKDLVHPDDLHLVEKSEILSAKSGLHDVVHRIIRPDGEVRYVHELADIERNDDGKAVFLNGTVQDITELKMIEQDLIEQRQRLYQALKAAERASSAKSEFLSSMSHELRTPLNSILGFAQVLVRNKSLTDMQRDGLHEIILAGKHLLELINGLLDFAQIETGKVVLDITELALNPLIDDCIALLKPQAINKAVTLSVEISDKVMLHADRLRLKQVLLNLVSNAIKYNHPQGQVLIKVGADDEHVQIRVIDTGIGISAEKMDSMFTPFERLGQAGSAIEGSGIGLTITKTLVELMHGEIGVISQPGQGSEFYITLPKACS